MTTRVEPSFSGSETLKMSSKEIQMQVDEVEKNPKIIKCQRNVGEKKHKEPPNEHFGTFFT